MGIGIKLSAEGTKQLVGKSIQYAIDQDLPSVTLVHKGNIMSGRFIRDWGYELAMEEFGGELLDGGRGSRSLIQILVRTLSSNVIADAMLQQVLLRPREYSSLQRLTSLLLDALAAQVAVLVLRQERTCQMTCPV